MPLNPKKKGIFHRSSYVQLISGFSRYKQECGGTHPKQFKALEGSLNFQSKLTVELDHIFLAISIMTKV
ncbi:hypothetical protein Nepgr_028536 [Nepenthes gracilis]|uniref:Uncharacterized protein n=1 Tax=Nepenthes gracilis TaxID=150966 RepID=A0AAD3TCJ2_NEPGR|nr:hypothetical protein Nepgr_028536 [Nepenthes gracilis]